ncbi:MAG: hypothetical protein QF917_04730 [Candidatus Woesearchaeota archaeon]|jgi:glutamate dehydrogenase/leucine dehydrogenase|nr:hypothetical protein [Candidatus Woesearchaeota archaeon]|tara:strand:+ start:8074 stop:8214 length:141 start_codon:yes stop_codon:yes gene_type:complete
MVKAFDEIYEIMTELKINMRTAAYVYASNKIISAIDARGTVEYFRE